MSEYTLKVTEYTKEPYSRYKEDKLGGNGETFRKDFIIPCLKKHQKITIDLDGILDDYGSSFLSEAFAMLILDEGMNYDEIIKRIEFKSENTERVQHILTYLKEAKEEVQGKLVRR